MVLRGVRASGNARGKTYAAVLGLACLAACTYLFVAVWPAGRQPQLYSLLQMVQTALPASHLSGLMKNIVIDRVYFPKGRQDSGIAKVHGVVNGKYVEGNLRIQRTASYNPKEGAWTGVSSMPISARHPVYNKAVEKVVAQSIASAMKDVAKGKEKPPPKLPDTFLDPESAMAQEIARETSHAIREVFQGEESQGGQKLKTPAAPQLHQRVVNKVKAMRYARIKQQIVKSEPPPTRGTLSGCTCKRSFSYKGRTYNSCTRTDSDRAWCSTEGDECGYRSAASSTRAHTSSLWDFCEAPLVQTVKGCECDFPFVFNKKVYHSCLDASRTFLYGKEAQPGHGPRGVWCRTRGHCGEGEFEVVQGVRAFWDRCDVPPPQATAAALAMVAGPGGEGAMCGATAGDFHEHRRAFEFSGECGAGSVCAWQCASAAYCPSCAGGNCRCTSKKTGGEVCGSGSNRPPEYSHYECASGQCLFACGDASESCNDCNGGKCRCK
mmetsp:Transcript_22972/g.46387  ORF Transcript_22972/g.46387 Transcript_22972/m.46387 type:complete len:493 (-) Transcript_22972:257-1735(-)